jgi:anti-anti-sigma factor
MMVKTKRHNGVSILDIDGNIEPAEMVVVTNELKRLMDKHRFKIILHFYGLKKVDYAGLGILVENLRHFKEFNGGLKLVGITTKAKRLFYRCGAWNIFETYPNEESALRSFKPIRT